MNSIHIIPENDIANNLANKAPVLRQPGIKKKLISVLDKSFRILPVDMAGSKRVIDICFYPVRV